MANRTVNSKLLKQIIKDRGEDGLTKLAFTSRVSASWLQKAVTGKYPGAPRPMTRDALCRETGIPEDVLFPFAKTKGKKEAS